MTQDAPCVNPGRPSVKVRGLHESEIEESDRIMRLAFGTFLGLPDPMQFAGDAGYARGRWLNCPETCFAAELDGQLVGTCFASRWGSVGYFGPITTLPSVWDKGIGQRLMAPAIEALDARGVRHIGLFTFPHSAKHAVLYERFGFWPRFLTRIMTRPARTAVSPPQCVRFSDIPEAERDTYLAACREATSLLFEGLDLSGDIRHVHKNVLGETLLVLEKDRVAGFAMCHQGAGTEAGSRACLVKFATVRSDSNKHENLGLLLGACEAYASERGAAVVTVSANTACNEVCKYLKSNGFRIEIQGVAMQRPNEPGYYHPENFVLDDWR
ncbi:MAG: GNAT family N-acetyltransferase [Candidatus Hydrogenedentes bacterium]|nr:GNAT family N-acetyltransferase [Candidatus Hydrogenedentota bacterium]